MPSVSPKGVSTMSSPKYVLFGAVSSGKLVPVEIVEPKTEPSKATDELWEIAQRIEEISDEIEGARGMIKDLRTCSWLLRAVVLGRV